MLYGLLLFSFVLEGCASETICAGDDGMQVSFQTGTYYNKKWEETIGSYQYDAIPNQEVAVKVASQIFEGMQKSEAAQGYVPYSVFFDSQDEIWIVSFREKTDEVMVGGDCNIALQKKDGKVLRIWFGE